jgi:hypothetical protein
MWPLALWGWLQRRFVSIDGYVALDAIDATATLIESSDEQTISAIEETVTIIAASDTTLSSVNDATTVIQSC